MFLKIDIGRYCDQSIGDRVRPRSKACGWVALAVFCAKNRQLFRARCYAGGVRISKALHAMRLSSQF
jgi:hypothetical protein